VRFVRLGPRGSEIPAVLQKGVFYDLRSLTDDIDGAFLSSVGVRRARRALATKALPVLVVSEDFRIGAPIARPHNVICVGLNYAAHAAESGATPPEFPVMFFKPSSTVVGPNDSVDIPRGSVRTDWEAELGVVIGRPALYLDSPEQSAEHIAGYVVANDLSERDFQLVVSGGQWSKGKSSPGFTPLGPWLVTPDEVGQADFRLRSFVNREPRQDSSTADMVFPVDYLIWHLSQYMQLEAGDLLLTGTPEGVALSGRFPYLRAGDVCEIEIEGLGRQRQKFGQG
jgi:2,4-diketo-3-deoxy-L-fuconate hydrolase